MHMHTSLYSVQVHPHCVSLSFPPPDSPPRLCFSFIFMHLSLQMREKCDTVFSPAALLSFLPFLFPPRPCPAQMLRCERACSACLLSLVDFEQEGLQLYPFFCESSVFLSVGARRCLLLFTVLFLCMPTCLFLSLFAVFEVILKVIFFIWWQTAATVVILDLHVMLVNYFFLRYKFLYFWGNVLIISLLSGGHWCVNKYQIWWFASFRML